MSSIADRRDTRRVIVGPEFSISFLLKGHAYRDVRITNLSHGGCFAMVGARDARLDTVAKRLDFQRPEMVRFDSQERDLDMADAITQLRTLETTHEAALSATARVLNRPKLLDFLR
jgi:hypothetical protein